MRLSGGPLRSHCAVCCAVADQAGAAPTRQYVQVRTLRCFVGLFPAEPSLTDDLCFPVGVRALHSSRPCARTRTATARSCPRSSASSERDELRRKPISSLFHARLVFDSDAHPPAGTLLHNECGRDSVGHAARVLRDGSGQQNFAVSVRWRHGQRD